MDTFLVVMKIVALGCLSALSVYLIIVLTRLNSFLASVERDVHDFTVRAMPVFNNLEAITSRVRSITEGIENEIDMVKHSIGALRGIADSIVDFERKIQRRIEEPVLESASTIAGFYKGVKTFLKLIRI